MDAPERMDGQRRAAGTAPAFAVTLALLAVIACGRDREGGAVSRVAGLVQGKHRSRPIMRVEQGEFTNTDLRAYLEATGADLKGLPPESLSRLYDRFVDEMILLEAARQRGITVDEDERKAYLARFAVGVGPAVEPGDGGKPPAPGAYDRILVEKYTLLVVRDVRVDPAEVHDYYEQNKKEFLHQGLVKVSQILVDTEDKAVSVLRRLDRQGEAVFRKIAREESLGPEASQDGVMGVFEQGDLPADMERVIFSLDEGRTSQIVESAYGFHIFRLDRKDTPALRTESEAAPEIRQRILAQKMKESLAAHLAGLKETLSWEALPQNLFFTYQRSDE
jgi:parvulin-like peptidyl-prolyl isomerase